MGSNDNDKNDDIGHWLEKAGKVGKDAWIEVKGLFRRVEQDERVEESKEIAKWMWCSVVGFTVGSIYGGFMNYKEEFYRQLKSHPFAFEVATKENLAKAQMTREELRILAHDLGALRARRFMFGGLNYGGRVGGTLALLLSLDMSFNTLFKPVSMENRIACTTASSVITASTCALLFSPKGRKSSILPTALFFGGVTGVIFGGFKELASVQRNALELSRRQANSSEEDIIAQQQSSLSTTISELSKTLEISQATTTTTNNQSIINNINNGNTDPSS